jgi:hypothetical protein
LLFGIPCLDDRFILKPYLLVLQLNVAYFLRAPVGFGLVWNLNRLYSERNCRVYLSMSRDNQRAYQ